MIILLLLTYVSFYQLHALKYPNEIVDIPIVLCEPERIVIKIKTTSSNPSHIYADDFADDSDCSSRNMNKIALNHGECGMTSETTDKPAGVIHRICISVQLHPLFVTESDKSYCAQCVYIKSHVLDDFEQALDISDTAPTELAPQFDATSPPKCSYSIRKDSATGPEVHYASIGDSVFHVWKCESDNTGILVQNCHVEDGQGNRIMIIDQNGCGVDHYVMATPEYSSDLTTAYQETHVFKFASKTITRFICQIRICLQGEECRKLSPPKSCPSLDERIEEAKRLREAPQKGIKEIFNNIVEPPRAFEDAAVMMASGEIQPPSLQPNAPSIKNTTMGSIYFGYGFNTKRDRRETINKKFISRKPRFSMTNGYPEVDLVGELRVLESEQDVEYYERQKGPGIECTQTSSYVIFIVLLSATSVVMLILIVLLIIKSANGQNKITKFSH